MPVRCPAFIQIAPASAETVAPPPSLDTAQAMAQAKLTDKQVEVTALASPTTRVMADPKTGDYQVDVNRTGFKSEVEGWQLEGRQFEAPRGR